MKTTVSSKGQTVLPAELREMDHIEPGQEFDVERLDRGKYRLVRRAASPNNGAVDWLLACPEKGFFVPVASESTDTPGSTAASGAFAVSPGRRNPDGDGRSSWHACSSRDGRC